MKKELLLSILFLAVSCKSNNPNIVQEFPKDQKLERKQYAGNMFGNKDGIVIFGDKNGDNKTNADDTNNKNQSNKQNLWKRTVAFVSSILPISIVDENVGLISTDWGNIESISGNNDLYKLNIVVKGKELKKENISVSAFKKIEENGNIKDKDVEEIILNMILN